MLDRLNKKSLVIVGVLSLFLVLNDVLRCFLWDDIRFTFGKLIVYLVLLSASVRCLSLIWRKES